MTKIVFLDLETTGLDPFENEILEVGMIVREDGCEDKEIHFSVPYDKMKADARALQVNRYSDRARELKEVQVTPMQATALLYVHLNEAVVVGNNVQFDLRFVEHFLSETMPESKTPWHYHPVDLKALVAGMLNGDPPPWSTDDIADMINVPLPTDTRHTALGDARWNRDVYDTIYGGGKS